MVSEEPWEGHTLSLPCCDRGELDVHTHRFVSACTKHFIFIGLTGHSQAEFTRNSPGPGNEATSEQLPSSSPSPWINH